MFVVGGPGVARALGDANFKLGPRLTDYEWHFPDKAPRAFTSDIVSGEPEVSSFEVTADDRFMVLACDGLWEVLTSQSVVDLIRKYLDEGNTPELAAEKLVDIAIKLGSQDNITAIIVLL